MPPTIFFKNYIDKINFECYNVNTDNTDNTDNTERRGYMSKLSFSKRDVYLDIAERYEKYITLGVIKLNEKLPSVREAASELRVNPNTVQRAYSLLEEKGFIRSIPKKGAFVIFNNKQTNGCENFEILSSELFNLKAQGISKSKIISIVEEVYKNDSNQ